jgi:uncharacterized protein (DUF1778 family)
MSGRTALLIYCSVEQAELIRERAERDRRTISGYLLNIVMRAVEVQEKIAVTITQYQRLQPIGRMPIPAAQRTTMLLRCSRAEADRIRQAAKKRDTTISGFVFRCVERAWKLQAEIYN